MVGQDRVVEERMIGDSSEKDGHGHDDEDDETTDWKNELRLTDTSE